MNNYATEQVLLKYVWNMDNSLSIVSRLVADVTKVYDWVKYLTTPRKRHIDYNINAGVAALLCY